MSPSQKTDTEKLALDLIGFSENTPVERLNAKFDTLATKVNEKIFETEGELTGDDEGWVTRWSTAMVKLSEWINKKQSTTVVQQQSPTIKTEDAGANSKLMSLDIKQMATLTPSLNVEVFVRQMDTVFTSHVEKNMKLESTFILNIETKLCNDFRTTYQEHCKGTPITSWAEMRVYLLDRHQSTSTCFQELHLASSPRIKENQELRDFVAQVTTNGKERLTVIKARYKKDNDNKEITVDDLFELFLGQTVLRAMQESPKHQRHYHHIAPDLDQCYTLDKLAKKADRLLEREVNLGTSSATQLETFHIDSTHASMANELSRLQGQIAQLTLLAQQGQSDKPAQQQPNQLSGTEPPHKKWRPFNELVKDPDWLQIMAGKDCKYGLQCGKRDICPLIHPGQSQKPTSSPHNLYTDREDFRGGYQEMFTNN